MPGERANRSEGVACFGGCGVVEVRSVAEVTPDLCPSGCPRKVALAGGLTGVSEVAQLGKVEKPLDSGLVYELLLSFAALAL